MDIGTFPNDVEDVGVGKAVLAVLLIARALPELLDIKPVSYTHLTLPTTPYV